ncbi:hypothetical protein Unana1_06735 [Umbelopsis nana]
MAIYKTRAAIEELRRYIEQQPLVGTHYNYAFISHIINKRFEHCSPKKNVTIDKGIAQAQASKTAILAIFDEICNHNDEKQLHIKKLEEKDLAESEERVEDEEDDDEFTRTGPPKRSYNQSRPPLASDRELVPENQNEFRQRKVQSSSSGSTQNHEEETVQIEHVLQHHRQLQEELTSDLGRMAAQLKSNSLAFGDMLEKDNQVLKDAQDEVASNLDRLRKERTRLDRHNAKSWGTTFMTCGVVLFVALMFVLVFFTIKFLPKAR